MSALNTHLVPIKAALAEAKETLSEREWHTLRAILIIALHSEDRDEEVA